MPVFVVIHHGRNICVKDVDGGAAVIGFYAARHVRAKNQSEAIELTEKMILSDWVDGPYAEANSGEIPALEVDNAFELNFFQGIFNKRSNKGYTFYPEE